MIPDHSISKGYPHDEPISQKRFANRLNILPDGESKIQIHPTSAYPQFKGISWLQDQLFGRVTSFLRHRLFDYHEALKAAEAQIIDILFDRPFLPEDFGFEKLVGPKGIHDDPVTIYKSTFDDNITIHRDQDSNTHYIVLVREPDGEFKEYRLNLACQRVAYNTFFALGIKIELTEEEKAKVLIQSTTDDNKVNEELKKTGEHY
ncbi:MAG TPA: hypothetical protein ACFYEK_01065 [Candidatus Wunengus sp. YC60]|uniref:hypothetical protein n=1 Tax=Candidatus Wunengus sp. YC60 TaxID=3367697 RepID=UPI004028DB0F